MSRLSITESDQGVSIVDAGFEIIVWGKDKEEAEKNYIAAYIKALEDIEWD